MAKPSAGKTFVIILSIIVGVAALSTLIQYARFTQLAKSKPAGSGFVIDKTYFPFQGTYEKNLDGKIKKV